MLYAPWVLVVLGVLGLIICHVMRWKAAAGQGPPALFELACWATLIAGLCLWFG